MKRRDFLKIVPFAAAPLACAAVPQETTEPEIIDIYEKPSLKGKLIHCKNAQIQLFGEKARFIHENWRDYKFGRNGNDVNGIQSHVQGLKLHEMAGLPEDTIIYRVRITYYNPHFDECIGFEEYNRPTWLDINAALKLDRKWFNINEFSYSMWLTLYFIGEPEPLMKWLDRTNDPEITQKESFLVHARSMIIVDELKDIPGLDPCIIKMCEKLQSITPHT